MYKLGQVLRKIYDGFLSEHYLQKEFTSQSTREERTYMSAATLLAGLYPPKTYQIWNPDVPWQPIPIYSTSIDNYNVSICMLTLYGICCYVCVYLRTYYFNMQIYNIVNVIITLKFIIYSLSYL